LFRYERQMGAVATIYDSQTETTKIKIKKEMWLFWLFIYGPPDDANAAETASPKLMFAASWLHDFSFEVPAVQVAL
jgi:hypothetical protein